ncbi:MAG: rhodanese-like domain-containing protein [Gemmatimonadetes bacterium]|nr:rhodanese-like domain-containing protein [Gemmatimonadota bacterium]
METLTTEELILLLEDEPDTVLINVLDEDDFATAHIPHSCNVPIGSDRFEEKVEEFVGSIDTAIVVYGADAVSEASAIAAARLEEAGFIRVYDYEGGLGEWLAVGRGVERGST